MPKDLLPYPLSVFSLVLPLVIPLYCWNVDEKKNLYIRLTTMLFASPQAFYLLPIFILYTTNRKSLVNYQQSQVNKIKRKLRIYPYLLLWHVWSHTICIYILRLTYQGPAGNPMILIFVMEAEVICLIFFQSVCKV